MGKAPGDKPATVLVLRTCAEDGSSHDGFKWPVSGGPVEAPDWQPTEKCGNGLHGWLWGHGDWSLKVTGDVRWLVVEVEVKTIINLVGKVKFPRGVVIATFGHWQDAMAFIRERRPFGPNIGTTATGYYGHASATGYSGHASATGNYGWAIAGYHGEVRAAQSGVLTCLWWDEKSQRPRVAVGYVGENGIKPETWYAVDKNGQLVETVE